MLRTGKSSAGNRLRVCGAVCAGLVSLALLAGCNRGHSADVVATVNGHAIMHANMERMYAEQRGQTPGQLPSPEEADQLRLRVVGELIEEEIAEQRAAKLN